MNTEIEDSINHLQNSTKFLFTKQEVGDPFYIIDNIKDNICACTPFAVPNNDKQLTPVLFSDKNLAEKVTKLFNDNRTVTGLSNYYFNVLYFKPIECLIAEGMDEKGNLLLVPYTVDEIRTNYNLKTTDELKTIQR